MSSLSKFASRRVPVHRRSARALGIALAAGLLVGALGPVASAAPAAAGGYIVVLKDTAGDPRGVASEHSRKYSSSVSAVYKNSIKGYAATMPSDRLAKLRSDPRVAYVEEDGKVSKSATTQTPATWGLDRIDQRQLPLTNKFIYTNTGTGVTAYIIDTGILFSHSEFGTPTRAVSGHDYVDNDTDASDCDGHGTHVAGTVGGSTYGVAKDVSLVAVRVLDCTGSGYWSGVIAGIDWVTAHHAAGAPAVANMSLGGGASDAVDAAVQASIADGVSYAVAAGNSNRDACAYSPARVPGALTVAASTKTDTKASFSNYGNCVDLYAPGEGITSSTNTSNTSTGTWSGTSMASPHVAGVAALYLQGMPSATAATVSGAILGGATPNRITDTSVKRGKNSTSTTKPLLFTNY